MLSGIVDILEKRLKSWILSYVKKDFVARITNETTHSYRSVKNLFNTFKK